MFENGSLNDKIEVKDDREHNELSPKTGVTFLKAINSVHEWQGDALDIAIEGTDTGRYSTIDASTGWMPNSQTQLVGKARASRNSQIKIKDSLLTSSINRKS